MTITAIHAASAARLRLLDGGPRVPRTAAVRRLDAASDRPISLLRAPAGFGKTDVLREWAHGHRGPVEWLALPDEDSAQQQAAALTGLAARLRETPGEAPHGRDAETAAVVVDGLAHLGAPEMRDSLHALVDALGARRLLIATREDSPLPLPAPIEPVLLRAELAFSEAEAAALAHALELSLTPETTRSLWRASAGWPLGLRLLLRHARAADRSEWSDVAQMTDAAGHELLGTLLEGPGARSLLMAAVPERWPERLLPVLADPSVLDDAARQGAGWWERSGVEPVFVFQPLVRGVLRTAAGEELRRETQSRLARESLAAGRVREAFAAAVDARDWELARGCASRDIVEVTALLGAEPRLLAAAPKSVLRRDPLLGMLHALGLYVQGRTAAALSGFTAMVADVERRRLMRRALPEADQVWAQGLLTVGLRLLGRYELVRPALRRFTGLLEVALRRTSELDAAEDLFCTESAVTALLLGDPGEAIEFLDRRPLRAERRKRQHFYGDALRLLALAQRGEIEAVRAGVEELGTRVLPPGFAQSFYAIPLHLASAQLHLEAGEPEAARSELELTEAHWSTAEYWPLMLLARIDVIWAGEGAAAALDAFAAMRAEQRGRAGISPALQAELDAQQALLLAAEGRVSEALRLLPERSSRPVTVASRALLQLLAGSPQSALRSAEAALSLEGRSPRRSLELHLCAAVAAHRVGDERRLARARSRIEALSVRTGLVSPLAAVPSAERRDVFGGSQPLLARIEGLPEQFPAPPERPALTRKELAVLHDIEAGATMAESAQRHSVSLNTVKSQRRSLYRKLGVSQSSAAVQRARELGLI
ncbi:LuxR C-terminal-related transcriptional regulator [Leucobacter massiliensis]|uniref:HTH luxR-type domain-containing protein n=1 Tax=Leucobacter massiliensis TaxID=1686285 RepID=A0A2S9QN80_9MICO|nr:LuxR C-terminal-related transcriptional regulator [Leucobacter massiliensis]PRI11030.1 hypothetical protein B4915_09170 [Leucobacter massiliensis]